MSQEPSRANNKVTCQEENAGASKYYFRRRENLPGRCQSEIDDRSIHSHQTDPFAKCPRKCIQYVDRWTQPSLQSLVAAPRLVELLYLVLKYGQNGLGRVAFLKTGGERVSGEILLSLFSICLEGLFEYDFEIGGGCCRRGILEGGGRCGRLTHGEGEADEIDERRAGEH